jgi:hypothetical protein
MSVEKIQIADKTVLPPRLVGEVFHLTTKESYEKIKECGAILNNQSGHFTVNCSSGKSFGRLLGYVCLFDLRTDAEIIEHTLDNYYFLGPRWLSKRGRKYITWDLAYLFLDPQYYRQLIPNSRVHDYYRKTGEYHLAVPKSEVWVENSIPLSWIKKVLLVKMREPVPERNSLAGMANRLDPLNNGKR